MNENILMEIYLEWFEKGRQLAKEIYERKCDKNE